MLTAIRCLLAFTLTVTPPMCNIIWGVYNKEAYILDVIYTKVANGDFRARRREGSF
ncbi:hypothetical protein WJ0W_001200 [Paenibacillus melissococcoides]|uniref:Secreted protein n=1 Tax=Paenibacillus melissococcoides TaxID=2912268 RepID=A0ABM9FXL3_9BACL|nr:hypothetical protein WJ0W_001200 [Paenibacillus melissococcoides]